MYYLIDLFTMSSSLWVVVLLTTELRSWIHISTYIVTTHELRFTDVRAEFFERLRTQVF